MDEFVEDYRTQVRGVEAFVRAQGIVTPSRSPHRLHRSVAGLLRRPERGRRLSRRALAPAAKTLFYLPSPPDTATPDEKDAFFRDFNHHFNVMITPHEILPGHYLQLKWAARHPRHVRALFADGVYVEGWGTFCERLLLDLGWGGPLPRLAHLKKQLENTARAVVDIRVHTLGMTREQVLRFVKEEALQDDQFAANMWMRAITSSPQLTTYWLGYGQVTELHEDVRRARGAAFRLRDFMDGMMELGPVPVRHYRERLLGAGPELAQKQQPVGGDPVEELDVQAPDAVRALAEGADLGPGGEAASRFLHQHDVAHEEVQGGHHVGPALADVVGHRQLFLQHGAPLVDLLQGEIDEQVDAWVLAALLAARGVAARRGAGGLGRAECGTTAAAPAVDRSPRGLESFAGSGHPVAPHGGKLRAEHAGGHSREGVRGQQETAAGLSWNPRGGNLPKNMTPTRWPSCWCRMPRTSA